MTTYDFIFSEKKQNQYYRHIAFWLTWYICIGFMKHHGGYPDSSFWRGLSSTTFTLFLIEIAYTYITFYWFFSGYLVRKKYGSFILGLLCLTIVAYTLSGLVAFGNFFEQDTDVLLLNLLNHTRNFFVLGAPVICGFFITTKMLKIWYKKMEEKETLSRENDKAELQLLKAQVHPHFLFNTLNNIYSYTLNQSPQAPNLVLSLSDILHYMIVECEPVLVPLEKELKMICNYMNLEKVRYGNRLDMQINITEECKHKAIAPLLMIPFVENSFKHGSSQMLMHPWIKLYIHIEENILMFELSNSKPLQTVAKETKKGIGLTNVQKRLELLYPGQYLLKIESDAETFSVCMHVPLEEIHATISPKSKPEESASAKTFSYADQ